MNDRNMTTVAAKTQQKRIPAAMKRLEELLGSISQETGLLEEALASVSSPSPTTEAGGDSDREMGLASDLGVFAVKAEAMVVRLQRIREDLDL